MTPVNEENKDRDGYDDAVEEWPTPEYRREGVIYTCPCGEVVDPKDGEVEAALLVAGSQTKVCGMCAKELRDKIWEDYD